LITFDGVLIYVISENDHRQRAMLWRLKGSISL